MSNADFFNEIEKSIKQYLQEKQQAHYWQKETPSEATLTFIAVYEKIQLDKNDVQMTSMVAPTPEEQCPIALAAALFKYCISKAQTSHSGNGLYEQIHNNIFKAGNSSTCVYEVLPGNQDNFIENLTQVFQCVIVQPNFKIDNISLFIVEMEQLLGKLLSSFKPLEIAKAKLFFKSGFMDYVAKYSKDTSHKEMILLHWLMLLENGGLSAEDKIDNKDFYSFYDLYLSKEKHLKTDILNKIPDDMLAGLYQCGAHIKLTRILIQNLNLIDLWTLTGDLPKQYFDFNAAIKKITASKPVDLKEDLPIAPADAQKVMSFFQDYEKIKSNSRSGNNSPDTQVTTICMLSTQIRTAFETINQGHSCDQVVNNNSNGKLDPAYYPALVSSIEKSIMILFSGDKPFAAISLGEQSKVDNFITLISYLATLLEQHGLSFKKILPLSPKIELKLTYLLIYLLFITHKKDDLFSTELYKVLSQNTRTQCLNVYEDHQQEMSAELQHFKSQFNNTPTSFGLNPVTWAKWAFGGNTNNILCAMMISLCNQQTRHSERVRLIMAIAETVKYRLQSYQGREVYDKKFYREYIRPLFEQAVSEVKSFLGIYKIFFITEIDEQLSKLTIEDYQDPEKARSLKESLDLFFELFAFKETELYSKEAQEVYKNLEQLSAECSRNLALTRNSSSSNSNNASAATSIQLSQLTKNYN
jgi:hypothetical protein